MKRKEYKNPDLCSVDGCNNPRMTSTTVCIECYQRISNEMAETVTSGDCKPMKITDRSAYIKFTELINGADNDIE